MSGKPRVWLVTGVTSGFGQALAKVVLERGDTVIGTVRKEAQRAAFETLAPGRAHARLLDVTDAAAAGPLVDRVVHEFKGIDVLVNNAGYGLFGAVEELNDTEARRVFETNFFGLLNLTKAVLPHFRARKRGHIVNISSIAGLTGLAGIGLYSASKFAVVGLSDSLARELVPFGIHVTVVMPGGFRTNFSGGSMALAATTLPEYDGTPAAGPRDMVKRYHGTQKGDPRKAASAIVAAVDAAEPPTYLLLGPDAIAMAKRKLDALGAEFAAWESLGANTDFDI